ncbi:MULTISPECIES: hypothetical protein [Burkholderiaceae]|nr:MULTISPECIES: hypothetical protein [Burkholderiaceae]
MTTSSAIVPVPPEPPVYCAKAADGIRMAASTARAMARFDTRKP